MNFILLRKECSCIKREEEYHKILEFAVIFLGMTVGISRAYLRRQTRYQTESFV